MLIRLWWLIRKELQALMGNTQGRFLLIMPVLLQTALFPFAATLEVTGNTLAIYDQDGGAQSRELIERLTHMPAFTTVMPVAGEAGMTDAITGQQALIGLIIPQDFSRRLARGDTAKVQLIIDGRRSNGGQVAAGYINQVIARWQSEGKGLPELTVRHLYNPNIEFSWHILPSLVAIITTIGCLIVTALSVAREREEGTFDQLLVSPLTAGWIMAGKAVPGILVAVGQGTIVALAARFLYQVPFGGSTTLLMAGMVCYGLALAGIGLFVSSLCSTQQQAFLGVFSFMVPAVILSGYVSPIENMPLLFQWLAAVDPLSHFILLLKGVFLKDLGWSAAWPLLWPLLAIAGVTLSLALAMFRRHIA
ncbi:ABC transporter permease [Aeromonas rivipollensis]|uniref:ABC transporter permease n=1 Tax=Aeromonas rivipollensis TaxID=948519 RepID=UPI00259EA52F|nr:ABC transporter permease [Aeromonas rivipollensis]MDM5086817.1 ABC transporter permease [Aeromonas rivipollensis]MDM5099233.1 ABC transporter permease [Aeromonas rivipollensis]MDM5107603.1 ABC transporter permease [Aeromonas rivipollensis]